MAGQILRWFSDSRSVDKKDEQATGHPRRGRGRRSLDQEPTLDMVLLEILPSGQKRPLGQQKISGLRHRDQGLSRDAA